MNQRQWSCSKAVGRTESNWFSDIELDMNFVRSTAKSQLKQIRSLRAALRAVVDPAPAALAVVERNARELFEVAEILPENPIRERQDLARYRRRRQRRQS